MNLHQTHPVLIQTTHFLHDGDGLAEHYGIAGEAKHKIGPAPMCDHVHHLWDRKMTGTADQDVRNVSPCETESCQH